MIWLVTQIWVFLLAAFILGAGAGALFERRRRRDRSAPEPRPAAPRPQAPAAGNGPAQSDLTQIIGVDEATAARLGALGVRSFEQIANWSDENIAWIEDQLDAPGRVASQRWREQAGSLADPDHSLVTSG